MNAKKQEFVSRHGKLAEGRSQTSVSMDEKLLDWCRAQAKKDGRSLSNWLARLAEKAHQADENK